MISLLLAASLAYAQEPLDIGVLKDSDLRVVQKVLYPLAGRSEIDLSLGVMPFDGFTVAPQVAGAYTQHLSEKVGVQVQVGGGYGFKTARYTLLESSTYGVAVEAYRYLASLTAAAEWTPIYAKMNLGNGTILHHDVFVLLGAGATLEQSVFPSGEIAIAPTFPVGIGTRIYVSPNMALRFEFRDNLMYEYRAQSQTGAFKQNAAVTAGVALLGKAKK